LSKFEVMRDARWSYYSASSLKDFTRESNGGSRL
jgi:hypothetical protein